MSRLNQNTASPLPDPNWESELNMREIEQTPFPRNAPALIDERAAENPHSAMFNFFDDNEVLSYSDVANLSKKLAASFYQAGIRHGNHVAVMVETSSTYPLTWIALARLGAVTVPVNYRYTARELDYVLDDADVSCIVISAPLIPILEKTEGVNQLESAKIIVAGSDHNQNGFGHWEAMLETGEPAVLESVPSPALDDPMNIQYTSGTTGLPKGAILTHRYWLTFSRNGAAQFQDRLQRILISQPFYYVDAQWLTLVACWTSGAGFVARQMHSSMLLEWMRNYKLEYCNFPEVVARQPEQESDYMAHLVAMSCYSHRPENFRHYERRYGGAARQGFSMTELGCAIYMPMEADAMTGSGSVGIPVAFREVEIRDEEGKCVPDDLEGEICVRGDGMFIGYYNKPEATRDAFHPGGWFRTGDLGRRNASGWFWYLGRQKDMVRRSGENISAVEVEQVLRGVEEVLEAAVIPVPGDFRGEEVKAYLKLRPGATVDDALIKRIYMFSETNLASFKIPRYLEFIDEFPRTPSLKVKKSGLWQGKEDLTLNSWDQEDKCWK